MTLSLNEEFHGRGAGGGGGDWNLLDKFWPWYQTYTIWFGILIKNSSLIHAAWNVLRTFHLIKVKPFWAYKKWNSWLRISLVNVTKSEVSCRFSQVYWNPQWNTSLFVQVLSQMSGPLHHQYHLINEVN